MDSIYFLHGWGFNRYVWQGFIKQHCMDLQTTALDMPGYGSLETGTKFNSLQQVAEELNTIIKKKSIIVSWSLGAQAAMEFACNYPDKITALILMNASPSFIRRDKWSKGVNEERVYSLLNSLGHNKEKTLKRFYSELAIVGDSKRSIVKDFMRQQDKAPASLNNLKTGLNMLINEDQRQAFVQLPCPASMLYTDNDSLVSLDLMEECKKLKADIKTKVLNGAGHIPFIIKPVETAHWIRNEIKEALL